MTIYLLYETDLRDNYDSGNTWVYGVYSTYEKAEAAIKEAERIRFNELGEEYDFEDWDYYIGMRKVDE